MKPITSETVLYTLAVAVYVWHTISSAEAMEAGSDLEGVPYESYTVPGSAPSSALFAECLPASSQIQATLHSIRASDNGLEFTRYVPRQNATLSSESWEDVTRSPPVASVGECAAAAEQMGSAMFKYTAVGACQVTNLKYSTAIAHCEDAGAEAVFVSNSSCPFLTFDGGPSSGLPLQECIGINPGPLTRTEGKAYCDQLGFIIWSKAGGINVEDMGRIAAGMEFGLRGFMVNAFYVTLSKEWRWRGGDAVASADVIPSGFPANFGQLDMAYLDANFNFKLNFASSKTFEGAVICAKP